jgi:amino acid transporter
MSAQPPDAQCRPGLGTVVLLTTVLVAGLALTLAVMLVGDAMDGRVRARTAVAVFAMAVGFLAPVVAAMVLRRWRSFRRHGPGHWWRPGLLAGAFVAVWVVAVVTFAVIADPPPRPIIPFTPTFTIQFSPEGRPQFRVRGDFGGSEEQHGEQRSNGILVGDRPCAFRVHPNRDGVRAIDFSGVASLPGATGLELRGELTLAERAWFRVERLAGATLLVNDEVRDSPVLLEPGTYRVTIRGAPEG